MAQFRKRKKKKRNHVLLLLEAESNTTLETDLLFLAYMQYTYTSVHACKHKRGTERAAESEREHDEMGGESQGVLKI